MNPSPNHSEIAESIQTVELSKRTRQFIVAIRTSALKDNVYLPATQKTKTRLVIQIHNRLKHPPNRKYVLQAITGLPLSSQNNLTAHYHSVLIQETLEDDKCLVPLRELEERILEGFERDPFGFEPWGLFPLMSDVKPLPDGKFQLGFPSASGNKINKPGNLMHANGVHLACIQQLRNTLIVIRKMVEADDHGVFLPLTGEDAQRIYDLCDEVISVPNIPRDFVNSDTSVTEKPKEQCNCDAPHGYHRKSCNVAKYCQIICADDFSVTEKRRLTQEKWCACEAQAPENWIDITGTDSRGCWFNQCECGLNRKGHAHCNICGGLTAIW